MTVKDDMLQLAWILLGTAALTYVVHMIKHNSWQSGYWRGRADGWRMANRMSSIKVKSDEVFDYDKQN